MPCFYSASCLCTRCLLIKDWSPIGWLEDQLLPSFTGCEQNLSTEVTQQRTFGTRSQEHLLLLQGSRLHSRNELLYWVFSSMRLQPWRVFLAVCCLGHSPFILDDPVLLNELWISYHVQQSLWKKVKKVSSSVWKIRGFGHFIKFVFLLMVFVLFPLFGKCGNLCSYLGCYAEGRRFNSHGWVGTGANGKYEGRDLVVYSCRWGASVASFWKFKQELSKIKSWRVDKETSGRSGWWVCEDQKGGIGVHWVHCISEGEKMNALFHLLFLFLHISWITSNSMVKFTFHRLTFLF